MNVNPAEISTAWRQSSVFGSHDLTGVKKRGKLREWGDKGRQSLRIKKSMNFLTPADHKSFLT